MPPSTRRFAELLLALVLNVFEREGSLDPHEIVERIRPYVDLGFQELVFHFPGDDQTRFIDEFASDVLPLLRS